MDFQFAALNAPGHIDFGGQGFVEIAQALTRRGHRVIWLTYGEQANRLRRLGQRVLDYPVLHHLRSGQSFQSNAGIVDPSHEQVAGLQHFSEHLRSTRPDAVCFDRGIVYGAMATERLGIPYAAIGTPGGYWARQRGKGGTSSSNGPVPEYQALGARIATKLGWSDTRLDSCWIFSPYLNIAFTGKSFFEMDTLDKTSAFVNHFSGVCVARTDHRIGVSFGNSGDKLNEMILLLQTMQSLGVDAEVFVGHRSELRAHLESLLPQDKFRIHSWTDFSKATREIRALAFFGGIGTVWHCINNYVPMLVLSGGRGDQTRNAHAVKRLGIGEILDSQPPAHLTGIIEKLQDGDCLAGYQLKVDEFRAPENFTDTMVSVCDRLEQIAGSR